MRAARQSAARLLDPACAFQHAPVRWRPPLRSARWSSTASSSPRQWSTPLAKSLAEAIATTGPISVASYMRQCLTAPEGGYYTTRNEGRDQFGARGDFITSPEISQVFGELVGVWFVAEWMAQGRQNEGVHMIEFGPGRGTLMDDALRTISNFKQFAHTIEAVYLIEASPALRQAQKRLLCGEDAPMEEIDIGYRSTSKYSPSIPIVWCEDIRLLPRDPSKTPFIVAHEFFDALPIHVFQSVMAPPPVSPSKNITTTITEPPPPPPQSAPAIPQWRELLVSVTPPSPSPTTATTSSATARPRDSPPDEFQLALSPTPTPHSQYLPETSPRYKALKPRPGSTIEISPDALIHAAEIAVRIGGPGPSAARPACSTSPPPPPPVRPSGAALVLDYGPPATVPAGSLRGVAAHARVSPLARPGAVDLSADVDFVALAEAALRASAGVEVHGPVEQGFWLEGMGGGERVAALVRGLAEARRERIEGAWKRLVDRGPVGMGRVYKALAIVPCVEGREGRRPVGFGGDVEV
ncbi:S-adenosyl-L-methionine-dependent methyltransferase [Lineolata rhizophorae]|uniref:Protein arginine methyltransferase NDUFAF7 n=1 Tax=Lineolata rhizophorae TaxID=578093 RepID=A0A6A6P2E8_9PEZI|nr:S-adenosyl-L-methionine-dependent methyltransferase [Lineolata rhizophorae]